jgi:hypothetical protein
MRHTKIILPVVVLAGLLVGGVTSGKGFSAEILPHLGGETRACTFAFSRVEKPMKRFSPTTIIVGATVVTAAVLALIFWWRKPWPANPVAPVQPEQPVGEEELNGGDPEQVGGGDEPNTGGLAQIAEGERDAPPIQPESEPELIADADAPPMSPEPAPIAGKDGPAPKTSSFQHTPVIKQATENLRGRFEELKKTWTRLGWSWLHFCFIVHGELIGNGESIVFFAKNITQEQLRHFQELLEGGDVACAVRSDNVIHATEILVQKSAEGKFDALLIFPVPVGSKYIPLVNIMKSYPSKPVPWLLDCRCEASARKEISLRLCDLYAELVGHVETTALKAIHFAPQDVFVFADEAGKRRVAFLPELALFSLLPQSNEWSSYGKSDVYIAPEVCAVHKFAQLNQLSQQKTDLFTLTSIIFQLATGHTVFIKPSVSDLERLQEFKKGLVVEKVREECPALLQFLILDPEKRSTDVNVLRAAVNGMVFKTGIRKH